MIIPLPKQLFYILSKILVENTQRKLILTSYKTASFVIKKLKIKLVSAVLIAFLQLALLNASQILNLEWTENHAKLSNKKR
jgi:hypothetical protein